MTIGKYLGRAYQFGYVTRDFARAAKCMSERLGIGEISCFETDTLAYYREQPVPFRIRVGLVSLGTRQIELIEPIEGVTEFYQSALPDDDTPIALHHLGLLVDGPESEYVKTKQEVTGAGYPVVVEDRAAPGEHRENHYAYVDTRAELGHYLEFLWFAPSKREAFLPNRGRGI